MSEHHRPEGFARLRRLPLVGRAADWGLGPKAVSKHTLKRRRPHRRAGRHRVRLPVLRGRLLAARLHPRGRARRHRGQPAQPDQPGHALPKGSASRRLIQQPGRLTKVLYRRPHGTEWEELGLEQAMDMIALGGHTTSEQGVTGDSMNDLIALSGDPNTSIEDKTFACQVRAGRRSEETTAKLRGVRGGEMPTDAPARRRGARPPVPRATRTATPRSLPSAVRLLVPGTISLIGLTEIVGDNAEAGPATLTAALVSIPAVALGILVGTMIVRAAGVAGRSRLPAPPLSHGRIRPCGLPFVGVITPFVVLSPPITAKRPENGARPAANVA